MDSILISRASGCAVIGGAKIGAGIGSLKGEDRYLGPQQGHAGLHSQSLTAICARAFPGFVLLMISSYMLEISAGVVEMGDPLGPKHTPVDRHFSWRQAKPLRHVLWHDGLSRRPMQEHVGQRGLFEGLGIGKLDLEDPWMIDCKGGRSVVSEHWNPSCHHLRSFAVMKLHGAGQRRLRVWGRGRPLIPQLCPVRRNPSPCPPCHHSILNNVLNQDRICRTQVTGQCHPIHDGASSSCNGDEECMVTGSTELCGICT